MDNYWDRLMGTDEGAAQYMVAYGEGPGSPLRHKIGSYLKPEQKVLDVGCGPGWNFEHFLEYGPAVYYRGLDYSPRFVRVASERVKPLKIFKVGHAMDLPEPDNSFDVVLLQDVLEHTKGYKKPLREALRVARERVIVTFWHLTEDDDHININPEENDYDGWGAWYSQPKWEEFLNSLSIKWKHEVLQRRNQDTKWDIYIIDKGEN